jgi:hypothetical protein
MKLAWGAKVSREFREKIAAICARIAIVDASWLMACMAFETGHTFDPAKRNPVSGATGLIQFMPSTAAGLETNTDELARMSAEDQLEYVERYFKPYAGRIRSLSDCYMAILWPKAIGEPDDFALFSAGQAYAQNKGLDLDPDGAGPLQPDHVVTKDEATAFVRAALAKGLLPGNAIEISEAPAEQPPAPVEEMEVSAALTSIGGPSMDPFLAAGINGLFNIAPELIRLFGKGPIAERNATVAEKVIDMAKQVTSANSGEEAVNKMQVDPAAADKFRQAVQQNLDQWLGMITKLSQLDEASRDKARTFATSQPRTEVVFHFSFLELLSLLTVLFSFAGAAAMVVWGDLGSEVKTAIVTLMLIGGFNTVLTFWFGSSLGSLTKNAPKQ